MRLPNIIEVYHREAMLAPERRHGIVCGDAVSVAPEREWEQVIALEPQQEFAYPAKTYSFAIREAPAEARATISPTGRVAFALAGHYRIEIARAGHSWNYDFVAWQPDVARSVCPNGDEDDRRDAVRAITRGWKVDLDTLLTLATTGRCPTEFNPRSFGA